MPPTHVLIAGAGSAGSALAIHLARAGMEVVLVDAHPANFALRPDLPGERIWSETRPRLEALGVACEDIGHAVPATAIHWGGAEAELVNPPNPLHWAWALDRRKLDAALHASAEAAGARIIRQSQVRLVSGEPGEWRVELDSGAGLEARFVVDATGRAARVARQLGYRRRRADPTIAALRWWSGGDERSAFAVEAVADGWCYRLALPGGRGVIGAVTMRPLAPGGADAIWQRLTGRLKMIEPAAPEGGILGPAHFFDAAPGRIDHPFSPGFAAVGEACLATDPIEGRGIDRALRLSETFAYLLLSPPETQAERRTDYLALLHHLEVEHLLGRLETYRSSGVIGTAFCDLLVSGTGKMVSTPSMSASA